jgi:hypothetical protein
MGIISKGKSIQKSMLLAALAALILVIISLIMGRV